MMPGRVSPPPKKVNYYSRKSIFSFSIVLLYIYLIQAIVCSFFIGPDSPTSNLLYYINIHSTSESVLCSTSEYLGTHHIFPYSSDSIKLKFENLFFLFSLSLGPNGQDFLSIVRACHLTNWLGTSYGILQAICIQRPRWLFVKSNRHLCYKMFLILCHRLSI